MVSIYVFMLGVLLQALVGITTQLMYKNRIDKLVQQVDELTQENSAIKQEYQVLFEAHRDLLTTKQ
jgi:hypothetical protein